MADIAEQVSLDDPAFEGVRMQAVAFEEIYEMAATFEPHVDHVQQFLDSS